MTLRSSLRLLLGSTVALSAMVASPLLAQSSPGFSQLDVRPPDAAANLNSHLARLGENPRDVSALIGAGEAALDLDDPRAATGFFARADEISSGNGRVKAGLGRAMLQLQNPTEALRLFDQAERLRYPNSSFLSDRGLAKDLSGDQAGAQRDYQAALQAKPNDPELIRRYAVSLGISGQVDASEKMIEPLLYKNDRAAWRNRAFVLAMNGREQQARDITQKVMPKPLADAIQPYMERMAALTPAQRAAAVHFGSFPTNSGVRMAANAAAAPRIVTPSPAPTMPSTAATSSASRARQRVVVNAPAKTNTEPQIRQPVKTAALPSPTPAAPADAPAPKPSTVQPTPTPMPTPTPTPARPMVQGPVDPAPVDPAPVRQPAFGSSSVPATQTSANAPVQPSVNAATAPSPSPVATRTLADIIRELDVPESESKNQVAAVDLAEIAAMQARKREAARAAADKVKRDAAAKAKAEADAKAKVLAAEKAKLAKNPSRNWVQIGTGQSVSALGFTLKGLRKKHGSLSSKDAFTASWGRTNRLVVGPFPSFEKAKDFEASLKKGGADAFAWKSDAGEELNPVSGK